MRYSKCESQGCRSQLYLRQTAACGGVRHLHRACLRDRGYIADRDRSRLICYLCLSGNSLSSAKGAIGKKQMHYENAPVPEGDRATIEAEVRDAVDSSRRLHI